MDLTLLLIADYANTTADGKLNVMGIFESISAASFPATHAEMYLIARFTAGPAEYGRVFKMEVKLINEDATQELVNFSAENTVPRGQNGQKVHLNHLLRLNNLTFPTPGTYEFSVLVDNDLKGTLPIEVRGLPVTNS